MAVFFKMLPFSRFSRLLLSVSNSKIVTRAYIIFPSNVVEKIKNAAVDNEILPKLFGPTADEVTEGLDLSNKTCLITGANSGIGLEMTRCLNARNCHVLMVCRNIYKARVATKNICRNHDKLSYYEIYLASLQSVRKCAEELVKDQTKIDMVILNAGVFGLPWTLTEDGLETTFQVNYLSQYYLLLSIEHILAPNARVVFVSSESHRNIKWKPNNKLSLTESNVSLPPDEYTSIKAYNMSKLCGILAMHYLGYRWLDTGKKVFCAHPGSFVKTGLSSNWWVYETLYTLMKPFSKSIAQAASTPLYCATSKEVDGLSGLYMKDCKYASESDTAREFRLAFRMNDLSHELLQQRVPTDSTVEEVVQPRTEHETVTSTEPPKEPIEDCLISNYSG